MFKKLFVILTVLLFAGNALAWYNDVGNDSCLTVFSNTGVFYPSLNDPKIEPFLEIENNCGRTISGNLGIFFQTKDVGKVQITNIEQTVVRNAFEVEKTKTCNNRTEFNEKTGLGSCFTDDLNGATLDWTINQVTRFQEKTFTYNRTGYTYPFESFTKIFTSKTKTTGLTGYNLKESYGNVSIPEGKSWLRFTAQLPKGLIHKHGYFVVTLEDKFNNNFYSVLDPVWHTLGELPADGHVVALYHFNQSSGTTIDDEKNNYDATASNALIWDEAEKKWGTGAVGFDGVYYFTQATLMDTVPVKWTLEWWFMPQEEHAPSHGETWNMWHKRQDVSNYVQSYIRGADGDLYISFATGGNSGELFSTTTTWLQDTWYHVAIIFDSGKMGLFINGIEESHDSTVTAWTNGTTTDFCFNTNFLVIGDQLDGNYNLDELAFSDVNRFETAWDFPVPNIPPDFNITHINGNPFDEAMPVIPFNDGNATVTISVYDPDNDRIILDLNYSTADLQGTGTAFYIDVNLLDCSSLDWDTTPQDCNISIDVSGMADNNYFIIGNAYDGTDEYFDASDANFGLVHPIFSDLNVFAWNKYNESIDFNIATDVNVVFDFNVLMLDLNVDATRIYAVVTHGAGDDNCNLWIRNTQSCGWQHPKTKFFPFSLVESLNKLSHLQSASFEKKIYSHSSFNLAFGLLKDPTGTQELNNSADWLKVLITNVEADANIIYSQHFKADYVGTGSRTLSVWDCNQSVATPEGNNNCVRFSISATTAKSPTSSYSIVYTSNDNNQIISTDGNVTLNKDGNHWVYYNCATCNNAKYWELNTVAENSNIDRTRNWLSSTGTNFLLADDTFSTTTHFHWIGLGATHYFDYFVQVFDNVGNDYNSTIQRDKFEVVNLPPELRLINTPIGLTYYNNIIDINISIIDPYLNPIDDAVVCDFNLLDKDSVPVVLIDFNVAVVTNGGYSCHTTFDTSTVVDGNYSLAIRIRETSTAELYSIDYNSNTFFFDNTAPTHVFTAPTLADETDTGTYKYIFRISDSGSGAKSCRFSVIVNGLLDQNTTDDVNAGGYCEYVHVFNAFDDVVYLTITQTVDDVGNIGGVAVNTANVTYVRPFGIAKPDDVEDQDIAQVGIYSIFQIISSLGLIFVGFFGVLVVVLIFVMATRKVTGKA